VKACRQQGQHGTAQHEGRRLQALWRAIAGRLCCGELPTPHSGTLLLREWVIKNSESIFRLQHPRSGPTQQAGQGQADQAAAIRSSAPPPHITSALPMGTLFSAVGLSGRGVRKPLADADQDNMPGSHAVGPHLAGGLKQWKLRR
jgi:hypothetical protein